MVTGARRLHSPVDSELSVTDVGRGTPRSERATRRVRRQQRRRRAVLGAAVVGIVAAGTVVFLATRTSPSASRSAPRRAAATTGRATTTSAATTTTTGDPGALPQTPDQPAGSGPELETGTGALWHAVVTDDPATAMPFFFPVSAYQQVKAIQDPSRDWQRRLVGAYETDIHGLHARLGAGASTATLQGIEVPATATWVQPGSEYNKLSYWRVYGARVHYTLDGRPQSFTIASMISWRGRWYVVHLAKIA